MNHHSNSCSNLELGLSETETPLHPNGASTNPGSLQFLHSIRVYPPHESWNVQIQEKFSKLVEPNALNGSFQSGTPRLSRQTQVTRALCQRRKCFALLKNERTRVNINCSNKTSSTDVCEDKDDRATDRASNNLNMFHHRRLQSFSNHPIKSDNDCFYETKCDNQNKLHDRDIVPVRGLRNRHLAVGPNLSWSPTQIAAIESRLDTQSKFHSSQLLKSSGEDRGVRVRKWVEEKYASAPEGELHCYNHPRDQITETEVENRQSNFNGVQYATPRIDSKQKNRTRKVSRSTARRRCNRQNAPDSVNGELTNGRQTNLNMATIEKSSDFASLNANQECLYKRRLMALKDKLQSKGQPTMLLAYLESHETFEAIRLALDGRSKARIDVCLLWACLHGNSELSKLCLANGANPDARDAEGFSALHLASISGSQNTVELLISEGARVTGPASWDNKGEFTPIMLAAKNGYADLVSLLIKRGADVDAGLHARSVTPLHYAVRSGSIESVQLLIDAGANINPLLLYSETPLHIAIEEGFSEVVQILLKYGADVRASRGPNKVTSLHLSAQGNYYHITHQLLKAGADPNQADADGTTPLHIAAKSQCYDTVQVLLNYKANPNATDCNGKTPLHAGIFKASRNFECLKLLLEAGSDPNISDHAGYTPLHLAALNDSCYCVKMFLKHGGDVTKMTKGGSTALSIILRRTPAVMTHIQENLNNAINFIDHDQQYERDGQVQLDFSALLAGSGDGPECCLMSTFIQEGQKSFLRHPLCETFLFLKWSRVRTFFVFNLIFYMILVLGLTQYFYMVFTDTPDYHNEQQKAKLANKTLTRLISFVTNYIKFEYDCIDISPRYVNIRDSLLYSIWLMLLFLTIKEGFQALDSPRSYLSTLDNILVWPVIIGALTITTSIHYYQKVCPWQYHVAALVILVSWFELLLLVGRFPLFGLYVHMFAQVTKNFSKFLFTYICLINAFSSSFGILFHNQPPFKHRMIRLLKTLVMMTGEIEYDQWFYESKDKERILYPGTAHFVFALFLIFGTIILMNLLVGLAVSDIQGLQKSAGLDRLVRQTELIADFETFMFSRWLNFLLPKKFLKMLHDRILLLNVMYGNKFILNPKSFSSSRIPPELIESIKRLARNRDHFSRRRNAFADFRTLSNSAQLSGDLEGDLSRGVEAIRCGLEVLVWDTEDQHEEMGDVINKLNSLSTVVQDFIATSKSHFDQLQSNTDQESHFISCRSKCKSGSERSLSC